MSPIYQKDGEPGWYFELYLVEFGPYDTDTEAWDKYEQVVGSGCKSCQE